VWENAKSLALSLRAAYALHTAFRVTIRDLLRGTVLECPNLEELVETETTIIKAFDALKRVVDHAHAFDQGQETVLAPDGDEADQLAPPSTWSRYGRR
jgi:hypothetical protein